MAQAVKRLWPEVKLAIGPSIAEGWYYDLYAPFAFTPEHMEQIEAEMKKIIKEKLPLERFELPREEALNASYWRGDSNRESLQRIYGIGFPKKDELDAYLHRIEEAKKRDHRRLGRELGLYAFRDEAPGMPFYLPKGMVLRNTLLDYWHEMHDKWDYVEISTPQIMKRSLWETSGHWDHYKDNMYTTVIDEEDFAIKPMNCPGTILVYDLEPHSYRDLPMRCAELGKVHRHEMSGALHGMFRVRAFTQDDAHILLAPEQIQDEVVRITKLVDEVYEKFGLPYHIELSTMPEDHIGTKEDWDVATAALADAITSIGKEYIINEGDGAFYGPKLDFHVQDSLGRTWQCGTIQLDYQLPGRFDLEYTGSDGEKHTPVMIHRVVFGSVERFLGIITEHFGGAFPVWLAPVQVRVMNITDRSAEYAEDVVAKLKAQGVRAEVDLRNEKIGYKIREAQGQKIPYMLVVGDKEVENGTVSVRTRSGGDKGSISLDEFAETITKQIRDRELETV